GIGSSRGEGRSVKAAEAAINSPLLEASMDGAHGVLLSIAGGSDLGLFEINEAASLVQEAAHIEANIIFGTVIDDSLGDEVRVTVIAAGFDGGSPSRRSFDAPHTRGSIGSGRAGEISSRAGELSSSSAPARSSEPMSGASASAASSAGSLGAGRGAVPNYRDTDRMRPTEPTVAHNSRSHIQDADPDDDVDVPDFMRR